MADVNANIGVNIDTSAALGQLKNLQRQISQFHTSIAKSSEAAALAQRDLQRNFLNSVNSIGAFSAELRTVRTTSESFTNSLEKNKFSMREYFRYAGASTKTFGRLFKSEFDTIGRVAEDRVKTLQTQYIKMGRDASGVMKAIAIRPDQLDMGNYSTQLQVAAQKQALFNQLMRQGSTNLLNFGKNTQWAGRQLMVGFTLPLMAVGAAASKTFMAMEAQALKFRKVYGDLFTPEEETQQALANIQALGREFTKYGIAVSDTVGLAADAAAAGFSGIDLQRQTTEATRLSVLGQIDNQQALSTTIALQNAFAISSAELADNINFLNAVENQTVVSLDDITIAIPKVAPVIQQLGGDVKDLAFFMTAMKEGGINASEGANALKSGLAALINPTNSARTMLKGLSIDIDSIVNNNRGDLKATVIGFAQALDTLAPLERARAIEQMFGKFQFARLSALFANVTKDGTQAARVLDLAGASVQELATLSEKELGITADSAMNKFKKAVEDLKFAIIPVGEAFLKTVTPILDFITGIADKFAGLSDTTKKVITVLVTVIGGLGPVLLMTFGLLANGIANIMKLFLTLRTGYQKLTGQSKNLGEQTQYMTMEQLDAAAAAHSLNQAHATLTQQFNVETTVLEKLISTYQAATLAATKFASANPGMMIPPRVAGKFSTGGIVSGPGGPTDDEVPIMASNGEAVIPAATVNANRAVIDNLLKTGKFESRLDLGGAPTDAARSGASYRGVNRIVGGQSGLEEMSPEQIQARNERALAQIEINKARRAAMQMLPVPNVPNVIPQNKSTNTALEKYGPVPIGPDGKPAQYGHITTRINSSVDAILAELLALPEEIRKKRQAEIYKLKDLQALGGGKEDVNAYTSLATYQSSKLNQAVGEGKSAVPVQTFLDDFDHFGPKMFIPALQDGGTTLAAVNDELTQYQANLRTAVIEKGKQNKTDAITGEEYQKLEKELRSTLPAFSKLRMALDNAEARIDELRINPSAEFGRKVAADRPDLIANKGTRNEAVLVTGASGRPASTKVRLRGERYPKRDILGRQAMLAASQAGEDLGGATTEGAAKGAATRSPSKKTIKVGEDVARGLEVGMNNRRNNVAKSGENLAEAAVKGTRRVATRAAGEPGSPVADNMIMAGSPETRRRGVAYRPQGPSDVSRSVLLADAERALAQEKQRQADAAKKEYQLFRQREEKERNLAKVIQDENVHRQASMQRMGKFNNALMAGSFALSGISGVAQLFGGSLGKISSVIFALSGAMFALMSVTQALTQVQALSLVQGRLAAAQQAASFASYGKGLMGSSGIMGSILRFGLGLKTFLGPVGLVSAGLLATYGAIKASNAVREKERQRLEAFGDTISNVSKASKTLGDFFGYQPVSSLYTSTASVKPRTMQQTSELDKFLGSDQFNTDEVQSIVDSVKKNASNKSIKDSLTIAGFKMLGEGASQENVQTFIDSILSAAGKTDIILDFKSLKISKENIDGVMNSYRAGLNKLGDAYKGGTKTNMRLENPDGTFRTESIRSNQREVTTELNNQVKAISSFNESLGLAFQSGEISSETFLKAFKDLNTEIIKNTPNSAERIKLLTKTLELTDPTLAKLVGNIEDYNTVALIMQARTLGIAVAQEQLSLLSVKASGDLIISAAQVAAAAEIQAAVTKALAAITKEVNQNADKANSKGKLNALRERTKELQQQNKVMIALRKSGIDYATAQDLASDAGTRAMLLSAQSAGLNSKKWKQAIAQVKEYALANKKLEQSMIAGQDQGDYEKSRLEMVMNYIELQEHLIDLQNKPQLTKYETEIDSISTKLDDIKEKEDEINKAYDLQSKALTKIQTINEAMVASDQKRLSIANALTSGDIAAAAQAVQDYRAQSATAAMDASQEALLAGRDRAIGALGAEPLESQLKTLQKQKKALEETIKTEKSRIKWLGMTKDEIDDAVTSLDLAKNANIDINNPNFLNNILKGARGDSVALANALKTVGKEAQSALNALASLRTTQYNMNTLTGNVSNTTPFGQAQPKKVATNSLDFYDEPYTKTPFGQAPSAAEKKAKEQAALLGTVFGQSKSYVDSIGTPFGQMSMGGLVPKYFAAGGFARGTDTVPAMLTPGEFVVRKFAVDKFGVDNLRSINNGSFTPKSTLASVNNNSNSVYNYGVTVNVSNSNASTDDITRAVMTQIRNIDNQRVRRQR